MRALAAHASLLALAACASSAAAQAGSAALDLGRGEHALGDIGAVPVLQPRLRGQASVAGGLRYGYTESVLESRDAHHRIGLVLAGGYAPLPFVDLAASFDARYDAHVRSPDHGSGGVLGQTRMLGRASHEVLPGTRVGGELALRFPPAADFGAGASSMGLDLIAAGTHAFGGPALVSGTLGFRLDRSGHGVEDSTRLTVTDRAALGASDSNQVLLGVAGAYAFRPLVLLLGMSWDVLIGGAAPSALQSPLRLSVGARHELRRELWLEALATFALSQRPDPARIALVPIEPRVLLGASVSYAFGGTPAVAPPPLAALTGRVVDESRRPIANARVALGGRSVATDATGSFTLRDLPPAPAGAEVAIEALGFVPQRAALPLVAGDNTLGDIELLRERATLSGQVVDADGAPLAGALVTIASLGRDVTCDDEGRFTLEDLTPGPLELYAQAAQWQPLTQRIELLPGPGEVRIALVERLPLGQIRGTVRGARAAPLAAEISVAPIGDRLFAAEDGTFVLDVAPGHYQVTISAPGYEAQVREVDVEHNGVTVLLVDLRGVE